MVTTEICCQDASGTYQGDGTACTTVEACCFEDGTCEMIDPLCCDDAGGVSKGAGTYCAGDDPNGIDDVCETADGACCIEDPPDTWTCENETLAECQQDGGEFQGVGTGCAGDADYDGVDDICTMTRPIPAFTGWGLAALTLLLVIGGITVMRRLKAQAA